MVQEFLQSILHFHRRDPAMRVDMIALGLQDLPLDRIGNCPPCIIIHFEEIRLIVCAAIVKCAQPLLTFRIVVNHQRKILSCDRHISIEGIGTEIRIAVADMVLLSPDHSFLIKGACHIGKSGGSADSRRSCQFIHRLDCFPTGHKIFAVRKPVLCIQIDFMNICSIIRIVRDQLRRGLDADKIHQFIHIFMITAKVHCIIIRLGTRIIYHSTVPLFHLIQDVTETAVIVDVYRADRITKNLKIIQQRVMRNIQTREQIASATQITKSRIVGQIQLGDIIPITDQCHQLRIVAYIQMCKTHIGTVKKL